MKTVVNMVAIVWNQNLNTGKTKAIAPCIVHISRKIDSTLKLLRAGLEVGLAALPNPLS